VKTYDVSKIDEEKDKNKVFIRSVGLKKTI